jgi:hypothetical protein
MKKSLICAVAFAFVCSLAFVGMSMAETDKGPAEITFDSEKKPAIFPHAKHQENIKCAECHHSKDEHGAQVAYVEGQKIEKCATCHDGSIANKKVKNFKGAAHVNCKGCHKAGKKGPTKCKQCHVKK